MASEHYSSFEIGSTGNWSDLVDERGKDGRAQMAICCEPRLKGLSGQGENAGKGGGVALTGTFTWAELVDRQRPMMYSRTSRTEYSWDGWSYYWTPECSEYTSCLVQCSIVDVLACSSWSIVYGPARTGTNNRNFLSADFPVGSGFRLGCRLRGLYEKNLGK